jgi:hypothetical protein
METASHFIGEDCLQTYYNAQKGPRKVHKRKGRTLFVVYV